MSNNYPHMISISDPDGDLPNQIFVAVERRIVQQCKDLVTGMYVMLSNHFIFNLEYNPKVKDVLLFLQEKLLQHNGAQFKKSAMYSSVVSGIDCCLSD